MCVDPEAVRGARVVPQVFPRISKFAYRVTTLTEFQETLAQLYGAGAEGGSIDQLLADMDGGPIDDGSNDDSLESAAADNELVKFVNKVIIDAYNQKVSDIHIEPMPGKLKTGIRFRIDGTLVPYIEVPAHFRQAMVTRLKIMCDLDISERRKPQDGKIKFKKYGPLDIELRVATIPSTGGVEDVVMRILAAGEPIPLEKLGLTTAQPGAAGEDRHQALRPVLRLRPDRLRQDHHAAFDPEVPQHAGHQDLDRRGPGRNHAERPAPGPDQQEGRHRLRAGHARLPARRPGHHHGRRVARQGNRVHGRRGLADRPPGVLDPAHQLGARVHHPPDGHGHGPVQLCRRPARHPGPAPGQEAVRLQGVLCAGRRRDAAVRRPNTPRNCAIPRPGRPTTPAKPTSWSRAGTKTYGQDGQLKLYRAVGCDKCNGTGYKGRIGLHELLVADDAVKKLIQERARVAELFAQSVEGGMRTLKMDGMEKVMMGLTDIKMVRQVCIK